VTIAFKQGSVLTIIGPGGVLHALFSTIAVRLEAGQWGSRFPLIMNGLYGGSLPAAHAKAAMVEMTTIREELSQLLPALVVWDIEQPDQKPPWGDQVGDHVKHMAHYFMTITGRNLVDEIIDNLESQIEFGGPMEIVPFDGRM
jgi:hypothetical protein